MKTKITTALLTIVTVLGFAQTVLPPVQQNLVQHSVAQPPALAEKVLLKSSFGYLKMGISDSNLQTTSVEMIPGLGIGYRIISGSSGFDLSAAFNRREIANGGSKEKTFLYTLPKATYLYYIGNFYGGLGAAWGGVKKGEENFIGLIAGSVLGYDLMHTGKVRSFAQFEVSQPAIAATQKGDFPKAFAEFSVGAGF